MKINLEEVWFGFMSWDQIQPYKEQIIDMELEEMIKYHYPDWDIPRSYPEQKVSELKQHLANGNTYFWGAIYKGKLLGYHWSFTSKFIDKIRWNSRSSMFIEEARGLGLGSLAIRENIKKAKEIGCHQLATMYVPNNKAIIRCYEKENFEVSRLEAVLNIENDD